MKFRTGRRALRTRADMIDENAGLDPKAPAHNGPPLLLVSDRVLSWEWESLDRRKSKPEGSAGTAYAVETETPTALKMIEAKPIEP